MSDDPEKTAAGAEEAPAVEQKAGKNKRKQLELHDPVHNADLLVDSMEEVEFLQWLFEAHSLGIVTDFIYQPDSFLLTGKVDYMPMFPANPKKPKAKCLFRDHIYTADFKVVLASKFLEASSKGFVVMDNGKPGEDYTVWVDTKGTFMLHGGDRSFSINQKLVWEKYGVYIQKVVPKEFFRKLGVPPCLRYTFQKKQISHKYDGYNFIATQYGIAKSES